MDVFHEFHCQSRWPLSACIKVLQVFNINTADTKETIKGSSLVAKIIQRKLKKATHIKGQKIKTARGSHTTGINFHKVLEQFG